VLHLATALAERAAAADRSVHTWAYPYFLFAQGLADFRQGRFEKTIAVMRGEVSKVMGPMPRLVVAMALYQSGKVSEARLTLASAVLAYDWRPNQARDHYGWAADQMCHLFRREAEVMILPNVPAFLQGTYQPQDNDERIALVGICQFQGRGCAAARLFADAFATDPALEEALVSTCRAGASLGDRQLVGRTEELATECRYPAARCAALAGCGLGMDGTDIGEAERSRWRKQARDWLRADLLMWETTLQEGSPAARELIRTLLTYWQSESDLAGLREPGALERFSAEERQECVSLWRDVTALLGRSKATK